MKVGKAIEGLMEREELTGEQMAMDLHLSNSLVSAMKHNKRNMQRDIAESSLKAYDDATYNMEITHEFSQGQTAPRINGNGIDYENRLAVLLKTKAEIQEVLDTMDFNLFLKRPEHTSEDELNRIDSFIKELEEGAWWALNSTATLTHEYNRSSKKLKGDLSRKWKANEVIT